MAENGPWNSATTQQFIRPLIDNVIAVLQAGEAAAHAEVNGGEPMPAYKVWRRSFWFPLVFDANQPFPTCSVIPLRSRTRKNEDGPGVNETHSLEILIEDVGPEPDGLAISVMKRVQAAHIIIERAALGDLFNGFVPAKSQLPYWDIDHDYLAFRHKTMSVYRQNGSLIITFTGLMEKT